MKKRTVFFISDGTGITAETLGYSLITQFEGIKFSYITIPYVKTTEDASKAVDKINASRLEDKSRPLIFSTLIDASIRQHIATSQGMFLDLLSSFIGPLEAELNQKSCYRIGRSHSMNDPKSYESRINAINFALNTDDGVNVHNYDHADVIILGVSRSGKTPTSLYLSLQYGIRTSNYPLTDDDLTRLSLPNALNNFQAKCFGLMISAERLNAIREERRPGSRYASHAQCQKELRIIENLLRKEHIPYLDVTNLSIEEIATQIMSQKQIKRRTV